MRCRCAIGCSSALSCDGDDEIAVDGALKSIRSKLDVEDGLVVVASPISELKMSSLEVGFAVGIAGEAMCCGGGELDGVDSN